MSDKRSKAELYAMLAEAIRNTQPQPANPQPEPVRNTRSETKRKTQPRRTRQPAPKRTAKIKRVSRR